MVSTPDEDISSVMDEMPYGLYILGSHSQDGEVNGMMADWVMQVSFQPRLLAVSFENDAHSLANVRETGVFTINLLGQDDVGMELAKHFAQPYFDAKIIGRSDTPAVRIHHKLEGISFSRSPSGCPVLGAAMAWANCQAEQYLSVGDHTLVIGLVTEGQLLRSAEALTSTYTGWPYSG
jgi:flavin reductase (DIM6/NTAB) family NADH-FMN oxidoreductase RutF